MLGLLAPMTSGGVMNSFIHAIQTIVVPIRPKLMKSSNNVLFNSQKIRRVMRIEMRDRSKNRKPLQRGRYLSIEAIQMVQALKRAANLSDMCLEQAVEDKFRRLLKFDMIAVLRELLRQNQCLLALKVFQEIKKEEWYIPQLLLYADIITVLGSNGFLEKVQPIVMELKAESIVNPNVEEFNAVLESLMNLNLSGLAVECYYMMKSASCDPDRRTFEILIDGSEVDIRTNNVDLAVIQQEAKKFYKHSVNFMEDCDGIVKRKDVV